MKNIINCIVVLILLTGCDDFGFNQTRRYSGEKDSSGNYIILDTKTGNIKAFQNGQLVAIPGEEQLGQIKNLPTQTIPAMPVEIGTLRLKYRDGMYYYQGDIRAHIKTDKNPSANNSPEKNTEVAQKEIFENLEGIWKDSSLYSTRYITIKLLDSDGFEVTNFEITKGGLTRTVDQDGKPIHLSFAGSQKISPKNFESINGYSFTWNLAEWDSSKIKK